MCKMILCTLGPTHVDIYEKNTERDFMVLGGNSSTFIVVYETLFILCTHAVTYQFTFSK